MDCRNGADIDEACINGADINGACINDQLGLTLMGLTEMGLTLMELSEMGLALMGLAEMRLTLMRIAEMGFTLMTLAEMGLILMRLAEMRSTLIETCINYNTLHGDLSPPYLQQCVQIYSPVRSLRSASSYILVQSRSHSAAGDCTFVHAAATVWNALPVSVTSKDSLLSFKAALKTHLCASAYT